MQNAMRREDLTLDTALEPAFRLESSRAYTAGYEDGIGKRTTQDEI
jgi:hypothetical protein